MPKLIPLIKGCALNELFEAYKHELLSKNYESGHMLLILPTVMIDSIRMNVISYDLRHKLINNSYYVEEAPETLGNKSFTYSNQYYYTNE